MERAELKGIGVAIIAAIWLAAACPAKSIDQEVADSQVVAIGRLTKYVEDPDAKAEQQAARDYLRTHMNGAAPGLSSAAASQLRGTYTFSIQLLLKGQCPDPVTIHLQHIDSFGFGVEKLQIRENTSFVLFLVHPDDGWAPTDARWPIIPLGKEVKLSEAPPQADGADAKAIIIGLMVAGLDDPAVRGSTLRVLSGTRSPEIVTAARGYWDDSDYFVKQSALCCLATNQVVEAIPRILDMQRRVRAGEHNELGMSVELTAYNSPQAVPYLNAMLLDSDRTIQLKAMTALRTNKLADKSSIPFLITALSGSTIARPADATLHDLVPGSGPPPDPRQFSAQIRDEEIQKFTQWWADEQAGKHGAPATQSNFGRPAAN